MSIIIVEIVDTSLFGRSAAFVGILGKRVKHVKLLEVVDPVRTLVGHVVISAVVGNVHLIV